MKSKPTYQIPFDADGDMMNFEVPGDKPEWRDIQEFQAQLSVLELHRGRSSTTVEMVDEADHVFWLSIKEFMRLVRAYTLEKGKLPALWWTFKKQGSAYFIYEVQLDPAEKEKIDGMSQEELVRHYRFAPSGDLFFIHGPLGDYFAQTLKAKGGITPEISKKVGWDEGSVESAHYCSDQCLAVVGECVTGEYRCGKPATHETQSVFWLTIGIVDRLSERQRSHQPLCEEHAQQVNVHYKQDPDELCTPIKRG